MSPKQDLTKGLGPDAKKMVEKFEEEERAKYTLVTTDSDEALKQESLYTVDFLPGT